MIDAKRARELLDELEQLNNRATECHRELALLVAQGEEPNSEPEAVATSPSRKLTAEEIWVIRSSKESDTVLARRYNVSRGTIWSIRAGVSHRSAV